MSAIDELIRANPRLRRSLTCEGVAWSLAVLLASAIMILGWIWA